MIDSPAARIQLSLWSGSRPLHPSETSAALALLRVERTASIPHIFQKQAAKEGIDEGYCIEIAGIGA
jgi:hypothetical protein